MDPRFPRDPWPTDPEPHEWAGLQDRHERERAEFRARKAAKQAEIREARAAAGLPSPPEKDPT